ncbi:MAG: HAD family hydrolase [Bacilli bacterium]|nr:HAD family hydrolase [Bacilli bacterium]
MPSHLKDETGKKSDEFLDWVRAQRVLIYFDNQVDLIKAVELNNVFMNALTEVVIAIEGAHEVLKKLKEKYYIIVATNGPEIATKEKLSKIGCLDFVNEVLSADMFGYMKPRQEFFEAIQKLLNNYNNDEYLIIGDSLKSDVGFAMNCGFDSCWFNKNNEELDNSYKPTLTVNKLSDLIKLL